MVIRAALAFDPLTVDVKITLFQHSNSPFGAWHGANVLRHCGTTIGAGQAGACIHTILAFGSTNPT
jgi:hypothetical protein